MNQAIVGFTVTDSMIIAVSLVFELHCNFVSTAKRPKCIMNDKSSYEFL